MVVQVEVENEKEQVKLARTCARSVGGEKEVANNPLRTLTCDPSFGRHDI
jgi:hypothetical protein